MKRWRLALLGTVVLGSMWAAGCGSNSGKKAVRGGAGESSSPGGAGNAAPGAGTAGEAPTTNAGASPTDGGAPTGTAGVPNGNAGEANGTAGSGNVIELTSCDAPIVIDDTPAASIAPNQPTIWQA